MDGPVGPVEPDDEEPFLCLPPPDDPCWGDGWEVVVVVGVVLGVVVVEGAGGGVVTVTDGVVEDDGAQLPEMNVSPAGTSEEGAVPGGALTVSVVVPPVGSPTVIVQVSAEAFGIAAIAVVASTELAVMATIFSLRLFDTLL